MLRDTFGFHVCQWTGNLPCQIIVSSNTCLSCRCSSSYWKNPIEELGIDFLLLLLTVPWSKVGFLYASSMDFDSYLHGETRTEKRAELIWLPSWAWLQPKKKTRKQEEHFQRTKLETVTQAREIQCAR